MTTHKLTLTVPVVPRVGRRFILAAASTIAIAVAVVIGLSVFGGTSNAAAKQCAAFKSQAITWAQNYIAPLESNLPPSQVQQEMSKLAQATFQADAAQAGLTCSY